jgi:hypothetical protein
MPNTVRAADTGLPNLNRRSAISTLGMGIAGGASLATAATVDVAAPPKIADLIEEHRNANRSIGEANGRQNALDYAREYMSEARWFVIIDEATNQAFDDAVAAYDRALEAICEHRCAAPEEELLRLRYIAEAAAGANWPEDSECPSQLAVYFEALLSAVRNEEA